MSFLKPKPAKSSSENINNSLITSTYGGQMNQGAGATNFLAQLLGVSPQGVSGTANTVGNAANAIAGAGGAQQGYNNYLQMAGYAPAMRQMAQGVTGQGAASGLLNSGATAKALQTRGAELNQGFFNNYLQQLQGLSGLGLQAGGLVANTGQKSTSTGGGPSTAGAIASTVGSLASVFSDRRLKQDIKLLRRDPDGLGWYEFAYRWNAAKRYIGVIAQEVAKLRPHALGPERHGHMTVIYGAL
jgi:hypothetical protein